MKLSIITINYNNAEGLRKTLASVAAQTYPNIEHIIVDGGSTDNAREVLLQYKEKYPDIIRLFFWEENLGLGANWASCVKECRGKYICNCDNDDYWHNPNKLQLQLDYMESHSDCNVLITNHRCHNRGTGVITEEVAKIDRSIPLQKAMWGGCSFCNATIMYRADFMKAHLDLDEFINRRLSLQDWPAWVILAAYTDFDVLPISTATFGIETVSITRPDTYERLECRYKGDVIVYQYLCELFPDVFPFDKEGWNKYVYSQLMNMAFRKKDFQSAKKYAMLCEEKSIKYRCTKTKFLLYLWLRKIYNFIK